MSAPINTPREALEAILARLVAHAALKDSLPLPTAAVIAEVLDLAERGIASSMPFGVDPFYAKQAVEMLPKYRALLMVLNNPLNAPEIAKIDRILKSAEPEPRGLRDSRGNVQ